MLFFDCFALHIYLLATFASAFYEENMLAVKIIHTFALNMYEKAN